MIQCEIIGDIVRRWPDERGHVAFDVSCRERRAAPKGAGRRYDYADVTFRVRYRTGSLDGLLTAGTRVFVRGRLTARPTSDGEGATAVSIRIYATEVQVVSPDVWKRERPLSVPSVLSPDRDQSAPGVVTANARPGDPAVVFDPNAYRIPVEEKKDMEEEECDGGTAGFSPRVPEKEPGPDDAAARSAWESFRDFFCGRRMR